MFLILVFALAVAIVFGFWTGFTDAAYPTSGIIATRAVKPYQAIIISTIGSFIGMTLFGSAVAKTIGTAIISEDIASGEVIIAALFGGLIFDVIFGWIYAMPISETHVLIGGLIGGGIGAGGAGVIKVQGLIKKVIIPLLTSPFIAIVAAFMVTALVIRVFKNFSSSKINKYFRSLQVVSTFLFAMTDATNDAQKVMGIVTMLLLYYGFVSEFTVPFWVVLISYASISLGVLFGGWRIVETMARKITRLRPYQGFSGDLASSMLLGAAAIFGLPMSSTHVDNGAMIGTGLTRGGKAVKWGTTRNIIWAWVFTAPLTAVFSFLVLNVIKFLV